MSSPTPLQIGVELTSRCDLRCRHCLRDADEPAVDFDLDLFEMVASQAARLGPFHFALTGGEPTLHPRFSDFLRVLANHRLTAHVVTNGVRFPEIREQLLELQGTLTGVSVSLDGADASTHDELRGPGSFARAMMAIGLAVRDGWPVTVQCVVCRANRRQLAEVTALCGEMGVSLLLFAGVIPTARPRANDLALDRDELKGVAAEVVELARVADLRVGVSTGHFDPAPIAHCETLRHLGYNVDARGRLTFCCQLSGVAGSDDDVIADLRRVPLAEALRAHVRIASDVTAERLRRVAEHPDDPWLGFHCQHCYARFGKRGFERDPDDEEG